jgi:excisionase family DNA binding protein
VSEDASVERLSVSEAAEALGVTRDAVHKRINRGTIRHEKGEDGRLYVYVDASTDESKDESKVNPKVEVMERYIARLERDLEEAQMRDRENRRIIAMLTARIPAIEAPREEPPESSESPVPTPTPTETRGGPQEATETAERPTWWRRMFGG